jgi:acyl-CoA synthetase (NDP forming)
MTTGGADRVTTAVARVSTSRLDRLLAPESAVVVGGSGDRTKLGGKVVANLASRLGDSLFVVNPRHDPASDDRVNGTWVQAAADLPYAPDVAVLALPAAAVGASLAELDGLDLGGVVVLAEPTGGPAVRDAFEAQLRDFGARTGVPVLGPNTSGFRAYSEGTFVTFAGDVNAETLTGSRTANDVDRVHLVSQSGAMLAYLGGTLLRRRNVLLDYVVDVGNEVDVSAADCLEFLTARGARRVGLVLVGCPDWRSLRAGLRHAGEQGVHVVGLLVGRSSAGRAISASHTGAVGGSADAFRAV